MLIERIYIPYGQSLLVHKGCGVGLFWLSVDLSGCFTEFKPLEIAIDPCVDLRLSRLLPKGLGFEQVGECFHSGLILPLAHAEVFVG